jgi:alpha-ribazole phosphatase
VAELRARVGAAWDAWRAAGQDAAWVSHAGVIRAARLLARGVREVRAASDWPAEGLDFGAALLLRPG